MQVNKCEEDDVILSDVDTERAFLHYLVNKLMVVQYRLKEPKTPDIEFAQKSIEEVFGVLEARKKVIERDEEIEREENAEAGPKKLSSER